MYDVDQQFPDTKWNFIFNKLDLSNGQLTDVSWTKKTATPPLPGAREPIRKELWTKISGELMEEN